MTLWVIDPAVALITTEVAAGAAGAAGVVGAAGIAAFGDADDEQPVTAMESTATMRTKSDPRKAVDLRRKPTKASRPSGLIKASVIPVRDPRGMAFLT